MHWRIEHATPSPSWSEMCVTLFLQHCGRTNSPTLNPDDYSIWSVGLMQVKVYRSRIANVNELQMRASDRRVGTLWSVDRACCYRSQWRRRLSACVRVAGHTLSTKQKVSAILSCIYRKLLNWWKQQSSDIIFSQFYSEIVKFFTFVFNKVLLSHESGEVENIYVT